MGGRAGHHGAGAGRGDAGDAAGVRLYHGPAGGPEEREINMRSVKQWKS